MFYCFYKKNDLLLFRVINTVFCFRFCSCFLLLRQTSHTPGTTRLKVLQNVEPLTTPARKRILQDEYARFSDHDSHTHHMTLKNAVVELVASWRHHSKGYTFLIRTEENVVNFKVGIHVAHAYLDIGLRLRLRRRRGRQFDRRHVE